MRVIPLISIVIDAFPFGFDLYFLALIFNAVKNFDFLLFTKQYLRHGTVFL